MNQKFTADTFRELNEEINDFMHDHDVFDYDNVNIVIKKVSDEADGYHWEATLIPKPTADALKEVLVEEHGYVDVFWNEDDINERVSELFNEGELPTSTLTNEQMAAVKNTLSRIDWEYGLSWLSVDSAIKDAMGIEE